MADKEQISKDSGAALGYQGSQPGVANLLGGGVFTPDAFNQLIIDSSSFSVTLDSGTRNAIQWITAKDRILIGTADAEWRMSGHSNKPLTPSNFDLKKQTVWGSKDMQPLVLHEAVLFVDSVGRKLREMVWDGIDERYLSPDLMLLAEHITLSGGITTMAYQKNPDSIIWATLANGDLISCTYDKSQKVVAWARHPLPNGSEKEEAIDAIAAIPKVSDTYKFTYISENGKIWGIPLGDGSIGGPDIANVINIGGGVVGIRWIGHPFAVGDTVRITNTTNYNGNYILAADTSVNELRITDTYVAETFDGTEIIVKYIDGLYGSAGRMVQDSDGNLYYGHAWSVEKSTYITKIETDGNLVYDFLNPDDWPIDGQTSGFVRGMAITPDSQFLYIAIDWTGPTPRAYLQKYNLTTGNKVWGGASEYVTWPGYDIDIDLDGNVYIVRVSANNAYRFASADGAKTELIFAEGAYVCEVDDDLGIVITAAFRTGEADSYPSNLFITKLSDFSIGDDIAVGGNPTSQTTYTIGTEQLITLNGFIYVLSYTPTCTLYKLSWDGSSIAVVNSVAGPTHGRGMYVDLWDNIVVLNQDNATSQTEIFHYYDTDLTLLGTIDGFLGTMFNEWDLAVGGPWIKGNAIFDGILTEGSDTVAAISGSDAIGLGANSVCVIPGSTEDEVWISVCRAINGVYSRTIERMKPRNFGTNREDAFFVDSGLTYNGEAVSNFTGLEHLEGEEVAILGDGMVFPTQTVTNGTLPKDLDQTVTKAHIGLPYTYKVKPMRMDQATARGTSKGSIKKIYSVVVSFYKTMNAKYGNGKITSEFKYPPFETYSTPAELYTGDVDATLDGGYDVEDPIEITGSDPLPCTVRAIIPRLDVTGK